MHEIFIARQPIFDRELSVWAYELLFRSADVSVAEVVDADSATSQVVLNAFTVIGLDELVGQRPAFINFTRRFITEERKLPFPTGRVVIEVLEEVEPDAEVVAALSALKAQGYQIALDDFVLDEARRELVELADIIKLDVQALSEAQLTAQVQQLRPYKVRLLAEKVETQVQFEQCKRLGFHLFQGYFFSKPQTLRHTTLSAARVPVLTLLATLHRPDVDVDEVERVIGQDVGLSYKLLRYLNSAFFATRREIDSIRQAMLYLGLDELRTWASVLALAAVRDKPQELVATMVTRAKMCEGLAQRLGLGPKWQYFTVGLFSGLDALLDRPLDEVMQDLGLNEATQLAVLQHQGDAGRLLECALSYERGNWGRIVELNIEREAVIEAYLKAINWSDSVRSSWAA